MISFNTGITVLLIIGLLVAYYVLSKPNAQVTHDMVINDIKNAGSSIDTTLKSDEFKQGVKNLGSDIGKVATSIDTTIKSDQFQQGVKKLGSDIGKAAGTVKDEVVKFATDEKTKGTLVYIKDSVVGGVKSILTGTADMVCSAGPNRRFQDLNDAVCMKCGKAILQTKQQQKCHCEYDPHNDEDMNPGLTNEGLLCNSYY